VIAVALIFVAAVVLLPIKVVIGATAATLIFGVLCLQAEARVRARAAFVDAVLFPEGEAAGDRTISGPEHPLWTFGARRGPEPPAEHSLPGRFRA